jgi:hypothetical protein
MRPPQAQLRPMPWSCAHPSATIRTAATGSTFLSTCPRLSAYPSSPHPPRLGKQLAPTPGRSKKLGSNLEEGGIPFARPRYRTSAGVEPSGGEPPPDRTRCMLVLCASVPMSSHIPLQCARAGLLLGASVGALSSRCDTAA